MTAVLVASYIVNAIVFIYAVNVPSSRWLAADRNKSFWVLLIGVVGLAAVAGIVVDIAFFIGVVPRFGPSASPDTAGTSATGRKPANPFLKS